MYLGTLFVLLVVAVGVLVWSRKITARLRQEAAYEQLKALPVVARDFTTPEGAILCLEDAYRRRDLPAAVAAKDFSSEARLMVQRVSPTLRGDAEMVAKAAEALELSFRTHTEKAWPNFDGIESFFTKREPHAEGVVLVTEVCRFPDGSLSHQQILVAETPQGWRVLNPVGAK